MPIEHATILPRRKWMVADGERLVPVRLLPIPVDLEARSAPKPSEAEGSNPSPSNTNDTQGATDDN